MKNKQKYPKDSTLTKDDVLALEKAERDLQEGRTISLEDLKRELGE